MKIAIIHDDFSVFGGGEKMMFELAPEINADIITFSLSSEVKEILDKYSKKPKIIILKKKGDKINEEFKRYRFSKLNVKSQYDFFIFSGHQSLNAAKNHRPNLYYLNYIPGFISKEKNQDDFYLEATGFPVKDLLLRASLIKKRFIKKELPKKIQNSINNWAIKISTLKNPDISKILKNKSNEETFLKNLDKIEKIVTNSKNIQKKVEKIYGKCSKIIYPFIDTKEFKKQKSENFWLSINRIVPYKKIEMQIEAFKEMPDENLIIAGQKQVKNYYNSLLRSKLKNVKFLGLIPEKEKINLLSKCKGVIFTGIDEDFGLVPVEAMASGRPVIAPNEGGLKEIIINGKTGILIDKINPIKIIEAINKINQNPENFTQGSENLVKKFDKKEFTKMILKEITNKDFDGKFENIKIRKYKKGDENGILKLYKKCFREEMSLKEWKWKYLGNKEGHNIVLALDNKKLIGHYGTQVKKGLSQREIKIIHVTDICIKKEYRRKGILEKIIKYTFNEDFDLAYGFPRDSPLNTYIRNSFSEKPFKIKILSKKISPKKKKLENIKEIYKIREFSVDQKENLNNFWKKKSTELKISTKRDFNYLEWRILKSPLKDKLFLINKNKKLIGYFSVATKNGIAHITDILILDKNTKKEIVQKIEETINNKNKEVKILVNSLILEKALKKSGFVESGYKNFNYLSRLKKIPKIEDFYLTYSDTDSF